MILNSPTISGSLTVTGNIIASGSITLSGSVASASYAATASFVALAQSASYVLTAQTASFVANAQTASFVALAQSASNAVSAATASFANAFTVASTLTAQTLVVQTITSSVDFVTGSTRFGSLAANTHTFTGSMSVSGSGTFASSITATNGNFSVESSATNSVLDILTLTHTTSGTAASGLGAGILFRAERPSSGITLSRGAIYGVSGTDADDDGDLAFYTLRDTGAGGFNEKMRITSGGNVGIGTTTPGQLFEVVGGEIKAGRVDSTNEGGQVSFGRSTDNATAWYIDAYGNVASPQLRFVNVTNAVVAMTITGSNVGIGTSSPGEQLTLSRSTYPTVKLIETTDSFQGYLQYHSDTNEFRLVAQSNHPLIFSTNDTERMRIDAAGNLYFGCTSDPNASTNGIALFSNGEIDISRSNGTSGVFNRNTSNGQILDFRYNNTVVGSISTNANSLPSDRNFKKDISDISIGLNLITKLRPVHYRHKMDEDNEALSNGIIAQEMEEALSECGVENNSLLMLQHKPNEKENESQYWVDYTKMIPVLIKSIQELKSQNDDLQSQINELKAQ